MAGRQDDDRNAQDDPGQDTAADAALLAEIAAAVREAEEVPERYRRSAQAAFTWRTVDAELAELTAATLALTHDSALDDPALVRTTSVDEPRQLTFASPSLTLDVEVEADALRGQLIPAAAGTATVEFGSGFAVEVQSDEDGVFSLDRPRDAGPVRIRCRVGDLTVSTPWMPF